MSASGESFGWLAALAVLVNWRRLRRIALGAQRDELLQLMLIDGLRPALFGLGLGLVMSFAATRIFQSMLFGTKPLDPVVLSGVVAMLLAVAVLACLAPAWRASRLDAMKALRTE